MNWFTSDTHFYHTNVIAYCNRPFRDVEDMNEKLIERWNLMVKPGETIFHLGDFCFAGRSKTRPILERLNGEIILVQGNHDHSAHTRLFKTVVNAWHTKIAGQDVSLSHYPFWYEDSEKLDGGGRYKERRLENKGQWLLHGHVHHHWKRKDRMINVGVDVWNWAPVSQDEIEEIILSKPLPKSEEGK
jgi:calcineurin-like phosphoesterase family protein